MRSAQVADVAAVLRAVLAEVDAGNVSDGGPHGSQLLRRIEGAAVALEVAAGSRGPRPLTDSVAP